MKNYIPNINALEENHVKLLNALGFKNVSLLDTRDVRESDLYFEKSYDVCGGIFTLQIGLNNCYFGDKHIVPYVSIKSPYDSWWSKRWSLRKFMKEYDRFKEQLTYDILALEAINIVRECKDSEIVSDDEDEENE